jgi:hypothetical protein
MIVGRTQISITRFDLKPKSTSLQLEDDEQLVMYLVMNSLTFGAYIIRYENEIHSDKRPLIKKREKYIEGNMRDVICILKS